MKYIMPTPIIASPALDEDIAGGSKNDKVTICHKIPGSLGKSQTITISNNALQHHLDHGDVQGSCNGTEVEKEDAKKEEPVKSNQTGTITTTYPSSETDVKKEDTRTEDTKSTNESGTVVQPSTGTYRQADLSVIRNSAVESTSTVTTQSEPEPTNRKVYGTVKATVHVFNKSLTSRGILDFKIIDAHTQRVLSQEKMPGEFVWYTEWGYFNGDERALDDYFLEVVKLKEAYPPPPQDLFVAFTQPIFGQVTSKINNFYRGY